MTPSAKDYMLREYGSWSVLLLSYLAGLLAARSARPAHFLPLLALMLLMNSKQALTRWLRNRREAAALRIVSAQILSGAAILVWYFGADAATLLPLLLIPGMYLALLAYAGEHFLPTEIAGFAVLTLAAPVATFSADAPADLRLYAAVMLFFTAGVFKVRIFLGRRPSYRIAMLLYLCFTLLIFLALGISPVLLLPLADNAFYALFAPRMKLRTVGWTEVAKGILFLVCIGFFFTG